jgi:hypothetical protein
MWATRLGLAAVYRRLEGLASLGFPKKQILKQCEGKWFPREMIPENPRKGTGVKQRREGP